MNTKKAINSLLIPTALALILFEMGRQWWCTCGSFAIWSWDVHSQHNSQHIIDWYTFSHIIHGFIFYWITLGALPKLGASTGLSMAMLIESAWEILENSPFIIDRYRTATIALNYYGDSIVNSLSDLAAMSFGFLLAAKLPARTTLGLAVLAELFTLATIRDNLTLNVLMLIYPIDAIKAWQAGL